MAVIIGSRTIPGAVTPACNDCEITLCWDVSDEDYEEQKVFWDG